LLLSLGNYRLKSIINNNNKSLLDTTLLTTWLPEHFPQLAFQCPKSPAGLGHTDGKRPDGMTLITWRAGKPAVWDVTVVCTSAVSYLNSSAREAGAAAEFAASCKTPKYVSLTASHLFFPIAVETQGPLNEEARQLLCDLGRRISASSGDNREVIFLFQSVSVVVQRFNSVLLYDSCSVEYQPH